MRDMDLKARIRDIPDFPSPGVLFRDITPLLSDPDAFLFVLNALEKDAIARETQAVVGIESRGFIFGAPLAARMQVPFVPVRKHGKLPAPCESMEYSLEYGTNRLDIHIDALPGGERVYIVDDVLATGGTAAATAKLVEMIGGTVAGLGFLLELEFLGGRSNLTGYEAHSLVQY